MRGARILVISEEPQAKRGLRAVLSAQGHDVYAARPAEQLHSILLRNAVDLAVLGISSPGPGVAAACRDFRTMSDVPLIVLAPPGSDREKISALDAGADDYLATPYNTTELLARIRVILRRLHFEQPDVIKVVKLDGLLIDLVTRRVTSRGHEVRLTPKEFDLLQHLIANRNEIISHAELLRCVWGPAHCGHHGNLRVFINQLRRKIEPNPAQPRYLLTEPWVGYKFAMPAGPAAAMTF